MAGHVRKCTGEKKKKCDFCSFTNKYQYLVLRHEKTCKKNRQALALKDATNQNSHEKSTSSLEKCRVVRKKSLVSENTSSAENIDLALEISVKSGPNVLRKC